MIRVILSAGMQIMFLTCVLLAGCRHPPDEQQVRNAIAATVTSAEQGSAHGVGASISEDFDGNGGEFDRRTLTGLVQLLALRQQRIGVTMGPVSVEHRGERMVASFTVTLTSGQNFLPEQLGVYRVESAWRNEHGKWLCYSASWKH